MIRRILLLCFTSSLVVAQCPKPCAPPPCAPLPKPVYRVVLDNCGPDPSPCKCPIQAPPAQASPIIKPTVALPAVIPPPKVVGASASCLKTVLKPQPYEQLVSVPIISRYLQTLTKPVMEVITFNAIPCCPPPKAPCLCGAPLPPPCLCAPPPPPPCLCAPPPPPPCLCAPPPPPPCLCAPPPPLPAPLPLRFCLPAFLPSPPPLYSFLPPPCGC